MGILRSYKAFLATHKAKFVRAASRGECRQHPVITILDDGHQYKALIDHDNCIPGKEVTLKTHPDFMNELNRSVVLSIV